MKIFKEYGFFLAIAALMGLGYYEHVLSQSVAGNLLGFGLLFAVIVLAASAVAHHAELLAEKFGEPYGTLILTISAVVVEIVIIAIMSLHEHNPVLVRDTVYSAIMLDINGLLGFSAIVGGIKYGEQPYNVDSSNSYISMLLVALGTAMVMPAFVDAAHLKSYLYFNVAIFVVLYIVFTRIQLKTHRYFFEYRPAKESQKSDESHVAHPSINGWYHSIMLLLYIALIGALSELLAGFMAHTLSHFGLPLVIGAVAVALISAAPELITAVRAALENRMQTVVNIALGASLATVLLTIPAMIVVSDMMQLPLHLALTPVQIGLLLLTLLVSIVNFQDGETNVLEGFLHVVLFTLFVFMLFIGP